MRSTKQGKRLQPRTGATNTNREMIESFNATQEAPPLFRFGTSMRAALHSNEATPGPGTYSTKTVTLGPVMQSTVKSQPSYSLRGREKFGNPMLKAVDPTTTLEPGPGHYRPRIVNPIESHAPEFSFPKSSWMRDKNMMAPGPGAYRSATSVGSQVLSTKRNALKCEFGTSNRPPLLLVSTEVGPGQYSAPPDACDKQTDSRKKTVPMVKFGKGARGSIITMSTENAPGPGDYNLQPALCGGGSSYTMRSAPKCSMSGRNKFGSPF